MKQIRGLKFTYKGGKGSGHHGHTGGAGDGPGGSIAGAGSGGRASAGGNQGGASLPKGKHITSVTDEQVSKWTKQVDSWEGARQDSAYAALDDIKSNKAQGIVIEEKGVLKAIASVESESGEMWLNNLATKEKGYGTEMMRTTLNTSSNKQLILKWWASPEAKSFYKKLGFKTVADGSFVVKSKAAKRWLKDVKIKSIKESIELSNVELAESEPKNGVFIISGRSGD